MKIKIPYNKLSNLFHQLVLSLKKIVKYIRVWKKKYNVILYNKLKSEFNKFYINGRRVI